jgi:hypothetical protein
VPEITLTWVSGYRRSYRGRNDAPFIRSIMHAPDQTYIRPQPLHCLFRSRHLHAIVDYCLDRNDFHRVSRAEGPSQLTWRIGRQPGFDASVALEWRQSVCWIQTTDSYRRASDLISRCRGSWTETVPELRFIYESSTFPYGCSGNGFPRSRWQTRCAIVSLIDARH